MLLSISFVFYNKYTSACCCIVAVLVSLFSSRHNWIGNTMGCPHHSQPVILRTYRLRVMTGVCLNVIYLSWIWLNCVRPWTT
jgi:hypothetical protein